MRSIAILVGVLTTASSALVANTAQRPLLVSRTKLAHPAAAARQPVSSSPCKRCQVQTMLFGSKDAETPVQRLRAQLVAVGWFSWWAQVILSTVSGVLLLFANSVTDKISVFALPRSEESKTDDSMYHQDMKKVSFENQGGVPQRQKRPGLHVRLDQRSRKYYSRNIA